MPLSKLGVQCTLVLTGACVSAHPLASPTMDGGGLVGTWRAVEYWDRDSLSAPKRFPYGLHPCGYVIYTATRHVSVQLAQAPVPSRLPADSVRNGLPVDSAEAFALLLRHISYFGTYSVDSLRGLVVHHIEAEVGRVHTDTHTGRPFRLWGDTLVLGNERTWRRLLVREWPTSAPNLACVSVRR